MSELSSLRKKMVTCVVAGLTVAAVILQLGNSGTIKWFPPVVVFSLVGISLLAFLLLPFFWHWKERKAMAGTLGTYGLLYGIIRYSIAFDLACFGWKKIFGLQFVVPESIAELPMNQQSGEWLTWYYFGHSQAFGIIVALLQIVGSYLLLFRRTQLASAFVLFPLLMNLALINIFYQMNAGALLQSIILTTGLAFLILLEYKRLAGFFFTLPTNIPSLAFNNIQGKNLLRLSAIVFSYLFIWYLKSSMN